MYAELTSEFIFSLKSSYFNKKVCVPEVRDIFIELLNNQFDQFPVCGNIIHPVKLLLIYNERIAHLLSEVSEPLPFEYINDIV